MLSFLNRSVEDGFQATSRAKKAVACLLYVSRQPIAYVEKTLGRFGGGGFFGMAGPVRAVSSRTCDLLPTAARVAEILNPGFDLSGRLSKLLIRLELGIPADSVELATGAGRTLTRGDYLALLDGGLSTVSQIEESSDELILSHVGGSRPKLRAIRGACLAANRQTVSEDSKSPMLEPYQP